MSASIFPIRRVFRSHFQCQIPYVSTEGILESAYDENDVFQKLFETFFSPGSLRCRNLRRNFKILSLFFGFHFFLFSNSRRFTFVFSFLFAFSRRRFFLWLFRFFRFGCHFGRAGIRLFDCRRFFTRFFGRHLR